MFAREFTQLWLLLGVVVRYRAGSVRVFVYWYDAGDCHYESSTIVLCVMASYQVLRDLSSPPYPAFCGHLGGMLFVSSASVSVQPKYLLEQTYFHLQRKIRRISLANRDCVGAGSCSPSVTFYLLQHPSQSWQASYLPHTHNCLIQQRVRCD